MEKKLNAKDRIIVALDVSDYGRATELAAQLAGHVGMFKIGHELLTGVGLTAGVSLAKSHGVKVMLDAKFHDIPQAMTAAAYAAAVQQVDFFTVHAAAGLFGLNAVHAGLAKYAAERRELGFTARLPVPFAVTVITSISDEEHELLFRRPLHAAVQGFAHLAADRKMGIVCAPTDLPYLRDWSATRQSLIMTPGVRPSWYGAGERSQVDDHCRTATPAEAVRAGADYLVVGRPIIEPPQGMSSVDAVRRIIEEIESVVPRS